MGFNNNGCCSWFGYDRIAEQPSDMTSSSWRCWPCLKPAESQAQEHTGLKPQQQRMCASGCWPCSQAAPRGDLAPSRCWQCYASCITSPYLACCATSSYE